MYSLFESGSIYTNDKIGPEIYRMQIKLPLTAQKARAGQFIHVKINDSSRILRRPISISGAYPESGIVEIIYRVVGPGTENISKMKTGDFLDILGPLGKPFELPVENSIAVGGGVGIAPILFLSRQSKENLLTVVIGGRNEEEVFWKDLFPEKVKKVVVTTDDGSYGIKGYSVAVLPEILKDGNTKKMYVCGPLPMMKKAVEIADNSNVECEVSLERRMGCGTGTCLACVCNKVNGGHAKVCSDGPVFKSSEVIL